MSDLVSGKKNSKKDRNMWSDVHAELIRTTWHSNRLAWCMDIDDAHVKAEYQIREKVKEKLLRS
jgi:hypothetical protein